SAEYRSLPDKLDELVQVRIVDVGDSPVSCAGFDPVNEVVSLTRELLLLTIGGIRRCPNEEIDGMFALLIDERRDGFVADVIQPTAYEGKSLRRKIFHFGREVQLAIEPRLDGVRVR